MNAKGFLKAKLGQVMLKQNLSTWYKSSAYEK